MGEIVKYLEKLMAESTGVKLTPSVPTQDTPPVNISNIKLASPPSYELGQKVALHTTLCAVLVACCLNRVLQRSVYLRYGSVVTSGRSRLVIVSPPNDVCHRRLLRCDKL